MITTFEVFTRNNGRYYYRVIAETGHNILSSDGYETIAECFDAINDVRKQIKDRDNIDIRQSDDSTWKFSITDMSNVIVGYSMAFHSQKQCEKWIRLMQEYLPRARIVQLT